MVRAFALPPLENMVQWHERDLANSANERIVLPHAILLTDDLLGKLTEVFAGLRVDPVRMAEEIDRSGGGAMTENLMLALTARGLARADAHELLRRLTRRPQDGPSLAERARADAEVARYVGPAEIDGLLDPARYVAAAAEKTDRVVARLERELDR
ncbi:adenylosuccinate lyase [mine drainage metagenome]|uniref:Adenylosuccinate lyase n=1 Tax=mine drainage metagenome TaxID=410659 RepID=T0Y3X5_9ZZZZ